MSDSDSNYSDNEQDYYDYMNEHYEEEYQNIMSELDDDNNDNSPQYILIEAILDNNIKAVEFAINTLGADITMITHDHTHDNGYNIIQKNTPILHLAIKTGHIDIVLLILNLLLTYGKNIDMASIHGNTCLHIAASFCCRKILQELVKAGADVNSRNNRGETPLHIACCKSNWVIVRYLLAHGSDMYAIDNIGQTCLHNTFNYKVAQKLLFRGLNVNQKDFNGFTPLHTAVIRGYLLDEIMYLFIKYGANINEQDNEGRTPFHHTLIHIQQVNQVGCVQILLENGADLNITDNKGDSCMSIAMLQSHSVLQEILSFLKIRDESYYALVACEYLQELQILNILDYDTIVSLQEFTGPLVKQQIQVDDW